MTSLNIQQTKEMLLAAADAIISSVPLLTEVDRVIGDGDHGVGIGGGMEKAKEALEKMDQPADINSLYKNMGMAMINSMGGASGVIFGTMFLGGVKGLPAKTELDCATMAQMSRKSVDAIKQRGQAQVGDKTMVDAYEPAVQAMESYTGNDLAEMLSAAAEAAEKGVESTKNFIAKFGRARYLGERALGHQDAGATSVSIIISAMRDYVKGLSA
ncbi:MAG: dihydroxyacetone kinase subunit L [Clostridiales bacterium]|nr:dihydroxyacetone kinase subunit L [Clostridiales bacterium]